MLKRPSPRDGELDPQKVTSKVYTNIINNRHVSTCRLFFMSEDSKGGS